MGSTVVAAKSEQKKGKSKAPHDFDHEPQQLEQSPGAPEAGYGAIAGMPLFLDVSLQRKLAVGAVDDPREKEADQVAEAVMTTGDVATIQRKCTPGGSSSGECQESQKAREGDVLGTSVIQRRTNGGDLGQHDAPPIVHQALRSSSQPLDAAVLPLMESRFGRDFDEVRVHTDSLAAKSAQAINALAYTAGNDVVFAPGRYSPHSNEGKRLLAHELTHVVQQSGGDNTAQSLRTARDNTDAERDQAASQAKKGAAISPFTPVGSAVQRQPAPAPLTSRDDDIISVYPIFRGEFVPLQITLDDATASEFDADPGLQTALAIYLIALFTPAQGPVPETRRFLSGPRVRALIEQDLPVWMSTGQLPSLANLLAARGEELRKQQVRAGLENWLGVDPGTVDWNAQLPSLRTAFMSKMVVTTGEEAKLDRGEMFLNMLENEVAGNPQVDGAATPPDLADLVFQYASETADYSEGVRKLFAEKFLGSYLDAIAAIRFIPEGFDLARFAPRGPDIAEGRRESLIDQFIYAQAEGLATKFLLDRWTTSGANPEVYLKSMDLESEQNAVIDYLTDEFMRQATKDPNLASSIRDLAADKARYELLGGIVQIGLRNERFNQTLPAIARLEEDKLDDQQKAILHDPGTYYFSSSYLAEATSTILSQVTAGANVADATLENAQAIAGKAEIPKNFATLAFLLEIGVGIASLKRTLEEQRSIARQRFAGRMRLSWDKIAETIRHFGKAADDFIESKWIPTVKKVAKERVSKNYADIKKWHDNFGGETPKVVGRYRLAAFALEDVANALETGEAESATLNGQVISIKDVPNMRTTIKYLRGKADNLESKKGGDEKREDLQKAVDAYADVMRGIDSEKYKPNHFGSDVFKEARQRLGIGDFEFDVTYGMALQRQTVVTQNPFERWAIARYEYVELVYEHNDELLKFTIAGLGTIASFLLPGVAAAVLFVIDAGYGIYQAYQGKTQAQAVLDLARLDTDLDIQGVTVEDAEKALHDAKMALFIAIALAAAVPVFMIIRSVYKGIQAGRLLGDLAESNPALAARIVEGAGSTKMAGKLLMHFAGDGEKVFKALDLVKDGKRLDGLISKIKDAQLTLRLLERAGGEAGLTPLISRFKNYAKLEELLGKVESAERLASLFDLAKSERNVVKLLDAMKAERAEALLIGGLSTEQAIALHGLPEPAATNYLKLLKTGDPALREGMSDLLRLTSKGKLESRVVQETLEKTAEFMRTAKGPAGGDYVKRFENIAE